MNEYFLKLLKNKAYRKGEFTLSSGKTSEHYVNCKPVTLSAEGLYFIGHLLYPMVEEESVAVGGLTLGADPLVCAVSQHSMSQSRNLNALIIRKKSKGHGTKSMIEGPMPPAGSLITVLEDVITTGGSAIQAVDALRYVGYRVNRVVSIVDRQEGGEHAMIRAGVELHSLFTLEDLCRE